MSGPPPKSAATRQRRNKATSRAVLPLEGGKRKAPPLPKRYVSCFDKGHDVCGDKRHQVTWHELTVAFWKSTWASPMSAEYLEADVPGLYRLAELIDQFWTKPTATLAGEIRLQQQPYGLSPLDRRRLEWEVEKVTAVKAKRIPAPKLPKPGDDPRILHMGTR